MSSGWAKPEATTPGVEELGGLGFKVLAGVHEKSFKGCYKGSARIHVAVIGSWRKNDEIGAGVSRSLPFRT